MSEWPNDLILEFIDLYGQHSVLWDHENPDRKSRDKIYEAWTSIQSGLSTRFDISDLKKKKDSLLASYRMLRRKFLESQKKSDDGIGTYQPTWFAYQSLDKFLNSNQRVSPNRPNLSKDLQRTPLKRAAASKCSYYNSETEDEKEAEAKVTKAEPPKAKVSASEENMKTLTSAENIGLREPQVFGQSVGLQLCEVGKNQRIIAERVISEVLFYARLGNLTESSTVIVSQYADEEMDDEMQDEG